MLNQILYLIKQVVRNVFILAERSQIVDKPIVQDRAQSFFELLVIITI